ncbi:InlB B-repeat-containing protein [[Clostridium] innocuum]|nr:InlB B-repeat-containing protein [[Clostridium] innocuum]MCR0577623.1 InlB B-repeat-containing protein [[Clostridium] innocuum]
MKKKMKWRKLALALVLAVSCMPQSMKAQEDAAQTEALPFEITNIGVSSNTVKAKEAVTYTIDVQSEKPMSSRITIHLSAPVTKKEKGVTMKYDGNGRYTGIFQTSEDEEDGIWRVDRIDAGLENGDRILVYNTVDLPSYAVYAYDFSPLDVTVTDSTGADVTRPELHGISVLTKEVYPGSAIKYQFDASDDMSGIESISITLLSPSGKELKKDAKYSQDQKVYELTIPTDSDLEEGNWTIYSVALWDYKMNFVNYINRLFGSSSYENMRYLDMSAQGFQVVPDPDAAQGLSNVFYMTDSKTVNDHVYDGDLYIGENAFLTMKNVHVTGNIYVLGVLRSTNIKVDGTVFCRMSTTGYNNTQGTFMWSGTNSLYSVQATNRPVAVVPVRIDQTLTASRNGDVALKGVSLPNITLAVEGKDVQTDYRGRFDAGIVNIGEKDTANITWKLPYGIPAENKIAVERETPVSLHMLTPPDKLEYITGEKLSLKGMRIEAVYADGYKRETTAYKVEDIALTAGKHTIAVTYHGAKTSFVVTVKDIPVSSLKLDQNNVVLRPKESVQLQENIQPANATDKSVSWKSDNPAVASVDEKGRVTALKNGTAVISAVMKNGLRAECKITVKIAVDYVQLDSTYKDVYVTQTGQLNATVYPEDATNKKVKWRSTNTSVVSVDQTGHYKALKSGFAYIYATSEDNEHIERFCEINVNVPPVEVNIQESSLNLKRGQSYQLNYTAYSPTGVDVAFKWESVDPKIASVNQKGVITALREGVISITLNSSYYNGGDMVLVTVTNPVSALKMNKTSANMTKGSYLQLSASVSPSDASNKGLTWTSSNKNILTVSSSGKVYAKGFGTATITAQAKDGSKVKAASRIFSGYGISYVLNGGSNHKSNVSVYYNQAVKLYNPTRSGYSFKGWYSDSKYKTRVTSYKKGTKGNKKLYAKWSKNTYRITYKLNGGKNTKANPSTYSVTSSISLKNPSRKGYSFKGWYSDSKYKNKVTNIKKRTGNLTLYAKWSAASYRITYKLNGGKNTKSNPSAFTINSTVALKNPSRKGYSFKGWYSDSRYRTRVRTIKKGTTGNKTLYAKWSKNSYRITYKLNGGKNTKSNPAKYSITSSVKLKNPSRKGYRFTGWYTDAACKKKVTAIKKGTTGNKTFYAGWKI